MITASDWREVVKNSLRGFVVLELSPSGLILRDCALHEQALDLTPVKTSNRFGGTATEGRDDWQGALDSGCRNRRQS